MYEQYRSGWHGSESSSPNWLARFPEQAHDALIKLSWLERARQRALNDPANATGNAPLFAGVDVGGAQAETVVYVCERHDSRWGIVAMGAWRGEDSRGQVAAFLNEFRSRLCLVYVDAIGVGHNFGLHLCDCRFPVELVNVAPAWESSAVRQQIAAFACEAEAIKYNAFRGITRRLKGQPPGPESSTLKLSGTELNLRIQMFAMELLGPYVQLDRGEPLAADGGKWLQRPITARGGTIAGGSNQIQRNIIGERVLKLPR